MINFLKDILNKLNDALDVDKTAIELVENDIKEVVTEIQNIQIVWSEEYN